MMRVSRNLSLAVQYVLDEWVPPIIRDSKWFMVIPMKIVLKGRHEDYMTFKNWFYTATPKQISDLYAKGATTTSLQGETDLNEKSIKRILELVSTKNILEVGCGRGYLANILSQDHDVTACDIAIHKGLQKRYPKIQFLTADIENLPFADNQFDTVISTHTLEHTKDLTKAISELRRVAKKELIIVVPRQREYKYTFSLHTHFFPYEWSVINAFGGNADASIENLGDWLYIERVS